MQQQLGETIRKYRKQKNYTMTQLSHKLGISVGLLSNIETGKTDSFQLTLLNNIIEELNIPLTELKLFSKPYPIEELNINDIKNFKKIYPLLEKLIEAFISTSSALCFDEDKINLTTNMLIKDLQIITKLIKPAESK